MQACADGNCRSVRRLVRNRKRLKERDAATGYSPLHMAACNGHADVVSALLAAGASVSARDREGNTPLLVAAANNDVETSRILVQKSNPSAKNAKGESAILYFTQHGNSDGVSILLTAGAAVTQAVMHEAVRKNAVDIVRRLMTAPDLSAEVLNTAKDAWESLKEQPIVQQTGAWCCKMAIEYRDEAIGELIDVALEALE